MKKNNISVSILPVNVLKGEIVASSSKSYTHRAVITSIFTKKTIIINPLKCDDTAATLNVIRQLNKNVEINGNKITIWDKNCKVDKSLSGIKHINVGESGTLLRILLSILCARNGKYMINGEGSLRTRPNTAVVNALSQIGADIQGTGRKQTVPFRVIGTPSLMHGIIEISGAQSSQTVSSLILASAENNDGVVIKISDRLVSRPYVDITIDVLKHFGVTVVNYMGKYKKFIIPCGQKVKNVVKYKINGDYSSAAFIITAGCLTKSELTISGLLDDKQGDKRIIAILNAMGAKIGYNCGKVMINGPYNLHGIDIDAGDIPDLVPVLVVAGAFASGKTRIRNIKHLAIKESNRIKTPCEELRKLGGNVTFDDKMIEIKHSQLRYGKVDSRNDHRVAMAMAVAGICAKGVVITNAQAVAKSYPLFFKHLSILGVKQ
ncbi:MAG: 3-phosphoshikimate 1-carboxyvinyltransferase [Elusimicrobiota bacterium]